MKLQRTTVTTHWNGRQACNRAESQILTCNDRQTDRQINSNQTDGRGQTNRDVQDVDRHKELWIPRGRQRQRQNKTHIDGRERWDTAWQNYFSQTTGDERNLCKRKDMMFVCSLDWPEYAWVVTGYFSAVPGLEPHVSITQVQEYNDRPTCRTQIGTKIQCTRRMQHTGARHRLDEVERKTGTAEHMHTR